MIKVHCHTPEDTWAAGERLGRAAGAGTVVALVGTLGAGKTLFSRGVGAGLEVRSRVQSPTFVVVQEHEGGRLPLWHADLYRIGEDDELEQLALDEVLGGDGLVLIEWADRFPDILPADHLEVRFEIPTDGGRVLHLVAHGRRHRALEQAVAG